MIKICIMDWIFALDVSISLLSFQFSWVWVSKDVSTHPMLSSDAILGVSMVTQCLNAP